MNEPEVPEAFLVRSSPLFAWLTVAAVLVNLVSALLVGPWYLAVAAFWGFVGAVTVSWRARISPAGISYTNRLGKDWSCGWSELEDPRIGGLGGQPWVRATGPGRRRVRVNNGRVTDPQGRTYNKLTVQRLIQAWAGGSGTEDEPG